MREQLADIAANDPVRLKGFKVLGIFPFHLRYLTARTHIRMCKVRAQMQALLPEGQEEPTVNDFYNPTVQEPLLPLLFKYCMIGILNQRPFGWVLVPFIYLKLRRSSQRQIWQMYMTLYKMAEPAFFFSYWKMVHMKDNTLLKEATQ